MKESDLKKVLTKPVMDQSMDQKIADSLQNHNSDVDKKHSNAKGMRTQYLLLQKFSKIKISKIAIIFIVMAIAGAGTAWAAGHYVRSYPTEIKIMLEEELDIIIPDDPYKDYRKERFGTGNKKISLPKDNKGNVLEIDDNGFYTLEDGSTYLPPYSFYVPDSNRHENDRKSGDEAFASIGYPNLIPTYLYEYYVLAEGGYVCYENTNDMNVTHKWIMAEFFPDYDKDFDFRSIWVTFNPSEMSQKDAEIIHIRDNVNEDDYIFSSYTTQGGILCSIVEDLLTGNITVHISFESETMGNGSLMIEFINMEMDNINEILETIPLTEDNVTSQTQITE